MERRPYTGVKESQDLRINGLAASFARNVIQ